MQSSSSSSILSLSLSETPSKPCLSPISPLQPIYPMDSMINIVDEIDNGGIFLFETERQLIYTDKYSCAIHSVCIFGCWICTIPSAIISIFALIAAKKNQMTRAKVLFNIAFIFSFFGLILFVVQVGYLAWLLRYLLHSYHSTCFSSGVGMQQQTIIVLLLGLAVSTYGLDLSHAKRSAALEPRVANFIGDLYTQVIFPPLKDIVTKLAALVAEIVARVSQIGVLSADGRRVHPSDEQLRGFFSGLWNEALKPPLENTIQNIALLAAQVLAGIGSNGINLGIGKRDLTEEEMRGFFSGLWNEALKPPLENTLQNVALLAAQVLAGIGSNGINLGIGKRDLTEEEMRGFLDSLGQAVNDVYANVLQKPIENALSNGALMLAQVLAGLGTNGISLSGLLGKRDVDFSGREDELRGIFSSVTGAVVNGLAGVWNNIFQAPLETFVQNGALTAAGWLANLATEGVNLG
ncbi:unnamed protein product [Adineta ricciae]|uniref:Uncharacterized protein n=1 Tax=Adineta ricciae TaxID=249248 RepID=A0A813N0B0_ADIRI|nr:unnamed protein product [Adineta ricciae]